MKIRTKILFLLTAIAIVSAGLASWIGYSIARDALESQSFDKLTAVRELKANQVESYFEQIQNQLVTFSEDQMVVQAMREFNDSFFSLSEELEAKGMGQDDVDLELNLFYDRDFVPSLEARLGSQISKADYWPASRDARLSQHIYIGQNPFDTGSKHLMDDPGDETRYAEAHRKYHPLFRNFLERFGYYDIFLIDIKTGQIVYSVYKELDFGTSLMNGPYRDTNLKTAFDAARTADLNTFCRLVDFRPYAPSLLRPASFIASPIFDGNEKIGVAIFQMPVDRINDIMTSQGEWERVGLGRSGETYLVGDDFTLRNQSRFLIEDKTNYLKAVRDSGLNAATVRAIDETNSSIGRQVVHTPGTEAAVKGESGVDIFDDYRGVPVLSAYEPLNLPDVNWVIMSEIDRSEAFEAASRFRNRILVLLGVLTLVSLGVASYFSRDITRPLEMLARSASNLAGGDLDTAIKTKSQDEIGHLSTNFESMRVALKELVDRQSREIDALATPLIPLQKGIVVMPLVGEIDSHRVQRLRGDLVEGLHESEAKAVIIDLTGVPRLETVAIEALLRMAKAAQLMGVCSIITGIKPQIAENLAERDIRLDGVATKQSLQDGIEFALQRVEPVKRRTNECKKGNSDV